MPRGDGTGPWGQGSRTGRGLGNCSGYNTPGYTKGLARGFGSGRSTTFGRGLAWRRGGGGFRGNWGIRTSLYEPGVFAPPIYEPVVTPEDQVKMLKQEKEYLELEVKNITSALEEISQKINEFEKTE
jgi:hypothetical protein